MTVEVLVNYFKNKKFPNGLTWEEQEELSLDSTPFAKYDFTIKLSGNTKIDAEWRRIARKISILDLSKTNLWNIDSYIFSISPLKKLILPSCIKRLGIAAFLNSRLKQLDLSNTDIDTIYSFTFYNSPLEELKLPINIREIKKYAFYKAIVTFLDLTEYSELVEIKSHAFGHMNEENFEGLEYFLSSNSSIIEKSKKPSKSLKSHLQLLGLSESMLDNENPNNTKVINNIDKNISFLNVNYGYVDSNKNSEQSFETFELPSKDRGELEEGDYVAKENKKNEDFIEINNENSTSISLKPIKNRERPHTVSSNNSSLISNKTSILISDYIYYYDGIKVLDLSKIEDDNILNYSYIKDTIEVDRVIFGSKYLPISYLVKIKVNNLNACKFVTKRNFFSFLRVANLEDVKEWKITNEIFDWIASENYEYNPLELNNFIKPDTNFWESFSLELLDLSELSISNWNYSTFLSNIICNELVMPKTIRIISSNSFWMSDIGTVNLTDCKQLELIEHNAFYRANITEILLPEAKIITIME